MDQAGLISAWRQTIEGPGKCWVLFERGTCVVLSTPEMEIVTQAIALLKTWGPIQVGSTGGDFGIWTLENGLGWVVSGHHPDILNLIARDEVEPQATELSIGLKGRARRSEDAEALRVVHVEDPRANPGALP